MTTTENDTQVGDTPESLNGTVEPTAPAVKYPTYLELAKATWKLAYDLSPYGEQDMFCEDGVDSFLRALGLPALVEIDGNNGLADEYVTAWYNWQNWRSTGTLADQEDYALRSDLVRRLRAKLQHDEPKSLDVMNGWLTELGLETFAIPVRRHVGRYDVAYNASNEVNSARIQTALRTIFADPDLNVVVNYVGRIA